MKYAIIIPDGCADEPLEELGGRTPLETADLPNMQAIAAAGRVGRVATVPTGFKANSDVATLSLLGYDPRKYYTGRAPLEAAAMGLALGAADWAFRCNLVTLVDGAMVDYSASEMPSEQSHPLMHEINQQLGSERIEFVPGIGYRHLMVHRGGDFAKLVTQEPHDIDAGTPFAPHLPTGPGSELLNDLMKRSQSLLADHPINRLRVEVDRANPATSIWLWGQGRAPRIDRFEARFGLRGAVITAVDLIRGIGVLLGWDVLEVAGATGYIDTDYAAKGRAAAGALGQYDLVLVHVEAPDEVSHHKDAAEKIKAIENIDTHVVGPVWQAIRKFGDYRLLVMPDHATSCRSGRHADWPVPFAMVGTDVKSVVQRRFTESDAADSDLLLDPGSDLMGYLLRR